MACCTVDECNPTSARVDRDPVLSTTGLARLVARGVAWAGATGCYLTGLEAASDQHAGRRGRDALDDGRDGRLRSAEGGDRG